MIILAFMAIGAVGGALRAKKRGGNRLDMAHGAAIYGIIFALIGLFVAITMTRAS